MNRLIAHTLTFEGATAVEENKRLLDFFCYYRYTFIIKGGIRSRRSRGKQERSTSNYY